MRRGVEWLVKNQQPDGSWYGRWGVAYIYGTCFALRGLFSAAEVSGKGLLAPGHGARVANRRKGRDGAEEVGPLEAENEGAVASHAVLFFGFFGGWGVRPLQGSDPIFPFL